MRRQLRIREVGGTHLRRRRLAFHLPADLAPHVEVPARGAFEAVAGARPAREAEAGGTAAAADAKIKGQRPGVLVVVQLAMKRRAA